jgi:tRNA(Ile)-lysidine synthase
MADKIIKKVMQTVQGALPAAGRYLVACSGGADSLALTDALALLGIPLVVCHVEHGLRGDEGLKDALFVENFCRRRHLPFYCRHVDVKTYCRTNGLSVEDGARKLRYQALASCAKEQQTSCILTAHQKDDQAETVLLHLLRGSGTNGLAGMAAERALPGGLLLCRPLLTLSGAELRNYCRARQLSWCEDCTNSDETYTRNRIRRSLLPSLKLDFNPEIVDVLNRMALCLRQDEAYLRQQTDLIVPSCLKMLPDGSVSCHMDIWRQQPPALQIRLLQRQWQLFAAEGGLSYVLLQQLQELCWRNHSGKRLVLPGGREAFYAYGELRMQKFTPKKPIWPEVEPLQLTWAELENQVTVSRTREGKLTMSQGPEVKPLFTVGIVRDKLFQPSEILRSSGTCGIYPLEAAQALGTSLTVRNRLPGDVFAPYGGKGSKKLKEFFIDLKIPRPLRAIIVLAAVNNKILWIAGQRAAAWKEGCSKDGWLVFKMVKDR